MLFPYSMRAFFEIPSILRVRLRCINKDLKVFKRGGVFEKNEFLAINSFIQAY